MITVNKHERKLRLTDGSGRELICCPIALGVCPVGAKRAEGDGKTPEGLYYITTVNTSSKYFISLGISYPGWADALRGFREKRIGWRLAAVFWLCARLKLRPPWRTALGGFVMIHGEHPDGRTGDWTQGCIALNNEDMKRLASLCKKNEPVRILP